MTNLNICKTGLYTFHNDKSKLVDGLDNLLKKKKIRTNVKF